MKDKELKEFIAQDPALMQVFEAASESSPIVDKSRGVEGLILVGALLPVAKYILINFGLPWLNGLKKWHDLKLGAFYKTLDDEYKERGIDADKIGVVGQKMYEAIGKQTTPTEKAAWEALLRKVGESGK